MPQVHSPSNGSVPSSIDSSSSSSSIPGLESDNESLPEDFIAFNERKLRRALGQISDDESDESVSNIYAFSAVGSGDDHARTGPWMNGQLNTGSHSSGILSIRTGSDYSVRVDVNTDPEAGLPVTYGSAVISLCTIGMYLLDIDIDMQARTDNVVMFPAAGNTNLPTRPDHWNEGLEELLRIEYGNLRSMHGLTVSFDEFRNGRYAEQCGVGMD
ncbi:uncharacterized protein PAC_04872 [Phialocephala subalpina]|uniref:Uncharacterized protein n=1 Tax=Phialocephala subalpina TaxID=576137 RepID=A0A1L7WQF6_9HELO|nr:uncharacterized protein PAC_04872 [Phialocephala subalpina]